MALNIPRVVQSLFVSSSDASRVRDNLVTALQPILDFFNQYLIVGNDGSLGFRGAVAAPTVTATGALVGATLAVSGLTTLNGNLYVKSATSNGVVIQPPVAGPAFYITNIAGSVANFLVYDTGVVQAQGQINAPSFNNSTGFKFVLSVGEYWNTAPGANATFPFGRVVQNVQNATMGFTPFYMKWPFAGSVVGVSVNEAGPNVATKTIYIYKNGTQLFAWTSGADGNNATFWAAFGKGSYAFAQGDTMTVYGSVASTANTQLFLHLTLEMSG